LQTGLIAEFGFIESIEYTEDDVGKMSRGFRGFSQRRKGVIKVTNTY
jgi:hypothetical protein